VIQSWCGLGYVFCKKVVSGVGKWNDCGFEDGKAKESTKQN